MVCEWCCCKYPQEVSGKKWNKTQAEEDMRRRASQANDNAMSAFNWVWRVHHIRASWHNHTACKEGLPDGPPAVYTVMPAAVPL